MFRKILDLKLSSEQLFSENWRWVPLTNRDYRLGFRKGTFQSQFPAAIVNCETCLSSLKFSDSACIVPCTKISELHGKSRLCVTFTSHLLIMLTPTGFNKLCRILLQADERWTSCFSFTAIISFIWLSSNDFFSGFLFRTVKVGSKTAMNFFRLTLHPAVSMIFIYLFLHRHPFKDLERTN